MYQFNQHSSTYRHVNSARASAVTLKKNDDYRSEFHSHREYMCVVLSFQLSLIHILQFGTFTVNYGGMAFVVSYIVTYLIIGLPLLMSQLLLGQYGRVGQFQVWRITPILYGMGYTMLFLSNLKAVVDSPVIGFALSYVVRSFSKSLPWSNCQFDGAIKDLCIDEETRDKAQTAEICCTSIKKTNCFNFTYEFAALHYWKQVVDPNYEASKYSEVFQNLNLLMTGFMVGVWLLILIVVYRGFNRFKKVLHYLLVFVGISMTLFFILSFGNTGAKEGLGTLFQIHAGRLVTPKLWLRTFTHIIESQQLSNGAMILFGSFVAGKYRPDRDTLLIGAFKFMITILFTIFFFNLYGIIGKNYELKDLNCILIKGYDILFGLVPEFVAQLPVAQGFNIVYFSSVAVMVLIYVILQMTAVVDSIVDIFPLARTHRFYLVGGICLTNLLLELPLLTKVGPHLHILVKDFLETECSIVVIFIFSIVVFYVYGVQRLADDMEFILGIQLSQYWKGMWYIMPIVLLVPTLLTIIELLQGHGLTEYMKIPNILLLILFLLPIPTMGSFLYFKYLKKHNLIGLFKTDRTWGPQDSKGRKARKCFNPRKAIKYKSTDIQCKHHCLTQNIRLRCEEDKIENKKKVFLSIVSGKGETT